MKVMISPEIAQNPLDSSLYALLWSALWSAVKEKVAKPTRTEGKQAKGKASLAPY